MVQLKNKKIVGLILFLIGLVLLFALIIPKKDDHQLFYISGLGASISSAPSEMEVLNYNLKFSTLSSKNFKIKSIKPILNEKLENILLSNSINISVEKTLSKSNELLIEGEMIVDTSTLEEEELNHLLLDLNTFKVAFNNGEEIILSNGSGSGS